MSGLWVNFWSSSPPMREQDAKQDIDKSMSFKQAVLDCPESICCFHSINICFPRIFYMPWESPGTTRSLPSRSLCQWRGNATYAWPPRLHSWVLAIGCHMISLTLGTSSAPLHTRTRQPFLTLKHSLCWLTLFFLQYINFGGKKANLHITTIKRKVIWLAIGRK